MDIEPRQQPLDLRTRKRIAAMQHIQAVALDLFDQHGYDAVTITQIARAADVGERSIYRYFGTKPMLVLHDEADHLVIDVFAEQIGHHTLIDAVRVSLASIEALLQDGSGEALRRLKLIHENPDLLAAVAKYTDDIGDVLGTVIARARQLPDDDLVSRVRGRSIAAAFEVAIDHWYRDQQRGSLIDEIHQALDGLATITET